MKIIGYKKKISLLAAVCLFACSSVSYAAADDSLDAEIQQQQKILQDLNDRKVKAETEEVNLKLDKLEQALDELLKGNSKYDARNAVETLAEQILDIRRQVDGQQDLYQKMMEAVDRIETAAQKRAVYEDFGYRGDASSTKYLVYPGPAQNVSYTQDAINSQGNSTMIFRYSPNQLYKIYCRVNYLTDIELKKGEHLSFVGGGDTSAWAVNSSIVDGTTHIYIKPIVETSTTNLIITTDKRSYQLILNTSDWYNPIVKWSYDVESQQESLIQRAKDDKTVTGTFNVSSPDALDFDYSISGSGSPKPAAVFNDGENTFIKFNSSVKTMPPLFVRARGKKQVELVNYRIKDNYYIVDRVIDMAEIRISDREKVTIKHR